MGTLLITDSSACLPPRLARGLGVRVLPIGIVFADGTERLDEPSSARRVAGALRRGDALKSVPPSVLDYLEAIEPADERPGSTETDVVVLTPATEFTIMAATARRAAAVARRKVEVVDTRTAASAQGLVVEAAARAAAAGAGRAGVLAAAADAIDRVRLVAAIENLDTLGQTGLVPSSSLSAARRQGARPVFTFRDGGVTPIGDAGGSDLPTALLRCWSAMAGPEGEAPIVFHAGGAAAAADLRDSLGRLTGRPTRPVQRFSPAMTLHTGLGLVGMAWLAPG